MKKKPTLGPCQCNHCQKIWYGAFCKENHVVVPDGMTLCVNCWSELDNFLYRVSPGVYNSITCREDTREHPEFHREAKKWIADRTKKPLPAKTPYHRNVPVWMRRAIEKGWVGTNSRDVYTVTVQDGEPVDIVVTQDRSVLASPSAWQRRW